MAIHVRAAPLWTSASAFDRHVKRLAWSALLGSIALLFPEARDSSSIASDLIVALGAMVIVIAVLGLVRDISGYVRQESSRRREVARSSAQAAACRAVQTIQDRVANLLSVTVGSVDFVAEDETLSSETRDHARQARDSALAAARTVSAFKQSLGCGPGAPGSADWETPPDDGPPTATIVIGRGATWKYDERTRTVRAEDGTLVASLKHLRDRSALRTGRLIAQAPALWEVLADAQRLGITLLADPHRPEAEEHRIHQVLERINAVTDAIVY